MNTKKVSVLANLPALRKQIQTLASIYYTQRNYQNTKIYIQSTLISTNIQLQTGCALFGQNLAASEVWRLLWKFLNSDLTGVI